MDLSNGIELRPLSPAIGAEVGGLDLSRPLDRRTASEFLRAWHVHAALLFRDQDLSIEDQVRFGSVFGVVERNRTAKEGVADAPRIRFVSNRPIRGGKAILRKGPMQLHSDYCWREVPYRATLLYAIEAPRRGGETILASTYAAYDALPEALKARIEGLTAYNAYDTERDVTSRDDNLRPDRGGAAHPVVIVHPETGRRALYVNRLMTDHIVGLDRAESDRLLEELFGYTERPEFTYAHAWRPGDLLVWDNRCTLHGRNDFDPREPRVIRRITTRGEVPIPAAPAPA